MSLASPARVVRDPLAAYLAMGREIARAMSAPACLLFNESAHFDWVAEAVRLGFSLVMFTDENLDEAGQEEQVKRVADCAHASSVAVEAEMEGLPGVGGGLQEAPEETRLTDPDRARAFVKNTGVDALAINVGQVHLHGRTSVRLDMKRVSELKAALPVPLVLHGATSVSRDDLAEAIHRGVRKINVGSVLKRTFLEAMRAACDRTGTTYNPYEVIGSGLDRDVMAAGRAAMRTVVEDYMALFGSAGKSSGF
jgi:fructose/tagatose bisphosphate aldolase